MDRYVSSYTGVQIDEAVGLANAAAPQSTTYTKTEVNQTFAQKSELTPLPDVTASDNGKFLTVANGEWAVGSGLKVGVYRTISSSDVVHVNSNGIAYITKQGGRHLVCFDYAFYKNQYNEPIPVYPKFISCGGYATSPESANFSVAFYTSQTDQNASTLITDTTIGFWIGYTYLEQS